jgi:hypothetical protein
MARHILPRALREGQALWIELELCRTRPWIQDMRRHVELLLGEKS